MVLPRHAGSPPKASKTLTLAPSSTQITITPGPRVSRRSSVLKLQMARLPTTAVAAAENGATVNLNRIRVVRESERGL